MARLKRPTRKSDPAALAEAERLRRAGETYVAIQRATGLPLATLNRHFAAVGLAGRRADDAGAGAEDEELRIEARRTARKVMREIRRKAAESDVPALAAALDKTSKYERLLSGAPTEKSEASAPAPEEDDPLIAELRHRGRLPPLPGPGARGGVA